MAPRARSTDAKKPELVRPSCSSFLRLHITAHRSYTYRLLQVNTIRLLDLHPGHILDPILCELRNFAPNEAASCESLFYCWDMKHTENFNQCNDGTLSVTTVPFGALQHLRRKEMARNL